MTLCDLSLFGRAVVVAVNAPDLIKQRLYALNIRPGAELVLLKLSLLKKTYLIQAGSAVALSREVANWIVIRKI